MVGKYISCNIYNGIVKDHDIMFRIDMFECGTQTCTTQMVCIRNDNKEAICGFCVMFHQNLGQQGLWVCIKEGWETKTR